MHSIRVHLETVDSFLALDVAVDSVLALDVAVDSALALDLVMARESPAGRVGRLPGFLNIS